MSHRQRKSDVGFLPRYITGAEALAQVQATRRYADAVHAEVSASKLSDARRSAWATWYAQLYAWVNEVINRNRAALELGAAAIADGAEARNAQAAAWSQEARAAGAPATAPPPPVVPKTEYPDVLPTLQLGSLAIIALALLYFGRSRR